MCISDTNLRVQILKEIENAYNQSISKCVKVTEVTYKNIMI